jgi:hypothetical protein
VSVPPATVIVTRLGNDAVQEGEPGVIVNEALPNCATAPVPQKIGGQENSENVASNRTVVVAWAVLAPPARSAAAPRMAMKTRRPAAISPSSYAGRSDLCE